MKGHVSKSKVDGPPKEWHLPPMVSACMFLHTNQHVCKITSSIQLGAYIQKKRNILRDVKNIHLYS